MLALFDAFFVLQPDLSPHRAGVESAFLGLARTIKQRGKIFVAGEGSFGLVSRLMNAPFRALTALRLVPEIDARRQIMALGARYADAIWVVGSSEPLAEALQAARENFFNTIAFIENPPDSLRPSCDALVECEDARLTEAVCEALVNYFSGERAFERQPFIPESDFDDYDPFADEDSEDTHLPVIEVDPIHEAVMQWESDWKEARNIEQGGLSRAEIEAQREARKEALLNRDLSQLTGVDGWETHHYSLLVRADVESVGAALISLCEDAQWQPNVLHQTLTLGKFGYFLYRIEGQAWTCLLPYQTLQTEHEHFQFPTHLGETLSRQLQNACFSLSYSDNPFFLDYAMWQNREVLESHFTDFDNDDTKRVTFFSSLAASLDEQGINCYQRCEDLMREWKIYAPTLQADHFTPFRDFFEMRAGTQFELQNPRRTFYDGVEFVTITLPIERFDHIILAL